MGHGARFRAVCGDRYPVRALQHPVPARRRPRTRQFAHAERLLLIPDLLAYWLTGEQGTELTNASTTQLIDPRTRTWSYDLAARLGIDLDLFAPLRQPGDPAGVLRAGVLEETGLTGPVPVTAVGSHDTASAVAAVPATGERFAYICTGTWSLAGLELDAPVLTEESRAANFTNELGLDGTVRYLRNIMGLWLLQECVRAWGDPDLGVLLREAAAAAGAAVGRGRGGRRVPRARADAGADRRGVPGLRTAGARDRGEITRCILDSLALAHRRAIEEAQRLAGHPVDVVHIVGGGTRNALLCQLTADACGLPVVAGPTEAAALGNVLVQARAHGLVGDRAAMRRLLARTQPLTRYEPQGGTGRWREAQDRLAAR